MIKVAISGGFDPIHIGHARLIHEAAQLGDHLTIILNNDNWLMKKKGYVFMPQDERIELLMSMKFVDEVVLSHHEVDCIDMSVCEELCQIRPDIFANGGDRSQDLEDIPSPEYKTAEELSIQLAFNVGYGGKVQSSSDLVSKTLQ